MKGVEMKRKTRRSGKSGYRIFVQRTSAGCGKVDTGFSRESRAKYWNRSRLWVWIDSIQTHRDL